MDEFTATEQAYKNGYERGLQDAVKHGRWETVPGTKTRQTCSVCGMTGSENIKFYSYCPNCGAKMVGET